MFEASIAECMQKVGIKWSDVPGGTIPAWVAETDFRLPPTVESAVVSAIQRGDVGYRPADEASPLRTAWPPYLSQQWGIEVDRESIFGVPGVVAGIYAAVFAFSTPGGGVVVNPPAYRPFLEAPAELGRERVDVPLVEVDGESHLDLAGIERAFADGAELMLLCHPHNPTGTVFQPDQLGALAELAETYGVVVVSDEVHSPIVYPGVEFVSYASIAGPDNCVALVSMSKAMSFAGLLCGAAVVGERHRQRWVDVPRRLRSGPSLLGVLATEAALDFEAQRWLASMISFLDINRGRIASTLDDAFPEARHRPPDASYLYWADLSSTSIGADPEAAFAATGLRVEGDNEFGGTAPGRVRINFGTSTEILDQILARIQQAADTALDSKGAHR